MTARIELPSGPWNGHYEQHNREYPQHVVLEFADGLMRGDGIDGLAPFRIEGEYRIDRGQVLMGWIKTYEGAHSVLYLGALENRRIVGRWSLPGGAGTFALSPVAAADASGRRRGAR